MVDVPKLRRFEVVTFPCLKLNVSCILDHMIDSLDEAWT